ncbi:MAG TPA: hypothetical protein VMV49_04820 [Candidatus Deferrimicrobium sp.]|nr:hypothetical protein [Candidatus Deferrimicrobium sp.]
MNLEERKNELIEDLLDKHFILDAEIEVAFRKVPMENFLPREVAQYSYLDRPLPFYRNNRPMAAPHINAIFLQLLQLEPGKSYEVLQLTSMSGYFAALTSEVIKTGSIRIVEGDPEIVKVTRENLKNAAYDEIIEVIEMDPIEAFWKFPKSDRIIFCGAVPTATIEEIANAMPNDSILIAPVFSSPLLTIDQDMVRVVKSNGQIKMESCGKVAFIPIQSASFQKWASKTQHLIFEQIGKSLEEYFTTTLPREEPLLNLDLPEHIIEDYFEANTLYKKGFKKSAILLAILAVKETIQYFLTTKIDFTQIDETQLQSSVQDVLSDEQIRDYETLMDIEKSITNFDYRNPPNIDRLAQIALDTASKFLESKFK